MRPTLCPECFAPLSEPHKEACSLGQKRKRAIELATQTLYGKPVPDWAAPGLRASMEAEAELLVPERVIRLPNGVVWRIFKGGKK